MKICTRYAILSLCIISMFLPFSYHKIVDNSKIHYENSDGIVSGKNLPDDVIIESISAITDKKNMVSFPVFDLYDSPNEMTSSELFSSPHSLNRLKEMNDLLNRKFSYIEFTEQPLQMLAYYKNDEKFAITSNEKNLINQQVNIYGKETYVTSLNTVQMGRKLFYDTLENHIDEGVSFTDEDYAFSFDKPIPVILGYNYKEVYKLNDTFNLNFLQEDFEFKVIGFFSENLTLFIGLKNILLDNYICMPHFNINILPSDERIELMQQRYYLQKNHGLIQIESGITVQEYQNALEEIAESQNLRYSLYEVETPVGIIFE